MAIKDPIKRAAYQKRWAMANPDKMRAYRSKRTGRAKAYMLERTHGITLARYGLMVAAQHNKCAICGNAETAVHNRTRKPKRLTVDHDHATGKIRGLLCSKCNFCIGQADDSPMRLEAAASYLRAHS